MALNSWKEALGLYFTTSRCGTMKFVVVVVVVVVVAAAAAAAAAAGFVVVVVVVMISIIFLYCFRPPFRPKHGRLTAQLAWLLRF